MNISVFSVASLQKVFATLAVFAMVFSPFSNVQFASAACGQYNVVGPTVITNTDSSEFFDSIQDAINDCDTLVGHTIALLGDVTTTAQINVTLDVTIDGNGNTLTPSFAKTDNSNNSAIGILDVDGVSIVDLVIDGSLGTNLHGINAYESADVNLSGVTVENINRSALVVNGSAVTINNFNTTGSGWHAINVAQGSGVTTPSVLTVNATSGHGEVWPGVPHIYLDNIAQAVTVNDIASQYDFVEFPNPGNMALTARAYFLKPPVATLAITNPVADGAVVSGTYAFTADYVDNDETVDPILWAIRAGTCAASTGTVAGNVDGFSNSSTFVGSLFTATVDTSSFAPGEYCFVVNPTEGTGETDLRATRLFTIEEPTTPKQCVIASDTTTLGNGVASIPTFVHPAWTADLATTDADWIWSADAAQTATFVKTFNVDSLPTGAVLRMAVDNSYTASLNGTPLTCDGSGIENFGNPIDTCTAPVVAGINTLEVVAQNFGGPNAADLINPAGFIYELVISGSSCSPVVIPKYTVDGYKWNDVDADGEWDTAEEGIAGWTITLTNSDTDVATTTTTGAGGKYAFSVPAGNYEVTEVQQTGWEQTMVSGDGADGDRCYLSLGGESEVSGGTCDFGNHQNSVAACLVKDQNLLANGSFEEPIVTDHSGEWEIFPSVFGWDISTDGLELWRNLMGPASDGVQNAELDGNAPTAIDQAVTTVAGNKYKVSFDFAARPDTDATNNILEVRADGALLDTFTLDGTGDTQKDWVTYSYEFTATDSSTVISFEDIGTADSYGTLLDNTAVCLTEDNAEPVLGTLTIDKVVVGEGASSEQVFTFDTWLTENTVLSGAGTPVTFSNLVAGSYSFSEIALPSGWAVEGVSCRDGESAENDLDETLAGVTVNISNGENVTCVVTNRYTDGGSNEDGEYIIVRKQVTENSDTTKSFGFEASWLEEEGPADFSLVAGTEYVSGNLLSGQVYSVSELIEKGSGWSQTGASCVSSDEEREGNIFPGEFVLEDGETITCTFTNDQDVYQLEGYVWEDTNENGIFDTDESPLSGWGVNAAAEGQTTRETNSDATGYYKFIVPAGTWTITEDLQSGWNAIHPNPTQYVVTVPAIPLDVEVSLLNTVVGFFLPTAHAAVIGVPVDGLNFGNKQESSGSSSGSRRKRTNTDTPVPQVLGEATSTLPVGAPNTGAGGTAQPVESQNTFVTFTTVAATLRRSKNVR